MPKYLAIAFLLMLAYLASLSRASEQRTTDSQQIFDQLQSAREADQQHEAAIAELKQELALVSTQVDDQAIEISRLSDSQDRIAAITNQAAVGSVFQNDTPLCFKLDGTDIDIEKYLSEWIVADSPNVRFEGSRDDLVTHLAQHGITDLGDLSFATLQSIHAARVEQEIDEGKRSDVKTAPEPPQAAEPAPSTELALGPVAKGVSVSKEVHRSVGVNPLLPAPAADPCANGQCPQVQTHSTSSKVVTRSTSTVSTPRVAVSGQTTQWTWTSSHPLTKAQQRRACRQGQCR
jgi:hypothetical protein